MNLTDFWLARNHLEKPGKTQINEFIFIESIEKTSKWFFFFRKHKISRKFYHFDTFRIFSFSILFGEVEKTFFLTISKGHMNCIKEKK